MIVNSVVTDWISATEEFQGGASTGAPFVTFAIWLKAQQVCRYQPSCQGVDRQGSLLQRYDAQQAGLAGFGEYHGSVELQPLQPYGGLSDVDGEDSPVDGLRGQRSFDRYSQLCGISRGTEV